MTVLEFAPTSFWQMRNYAIARGDVPVGEIRCGSMREKAAITMEGASYTAGREGVLSSGFHLEENGNRVASAVVASALKGGFTVQAGGRTYTLARASTFGRAFALIENGSPIGSIARRGFFSRTSTADLPDDLAPGIAAFVIWLVIIIWQRQVMTTAIVGGVMAGGR